MLAEVLVIGFGTGEQSQLPLNYRSWKWETVVAQTLPPFLAAREREDGFPKQQLVVQWVRLRTPNAWGPGFDPWSGN